MAEFLARRDVDFLLYEWLDVVELTKRDHFAEHSRDTFDAVLDLSADIATKAVPADDGTYRITGTKMWITGGDHELTENIVHLVLAKAPGGGPGVKGISLFIVPKFLPDGTRNDVALVSLNHKMGNHATTNALLNFGDGTHRP